MLKYLSPVLLCLCLGLGLSLQPVQAFDLFNQDRGKKPEPPPPPPPPPKKPQKKPPPKRTPPPPVQKDFTLSGTSQWGDTFYASLVTPDGASLKQRWKPGGAQAVNGYAGYEIVSIQPRKVVISYPADAPCHTDRLEKGVDCSADGKTAILRMVLGKAIATPKNVATMARTVPTPSPQNAQPAANNNAAQQRAQQVFQGAQSKRIEAKDVPPGMRVVKTPFGDRLVPIKK